MKPLATTARPASVEPVAMVEVGVVEVVAINDGPAVGDVGIVVVDYPVAMPVASPVMPTPTIPSEETDAEADSKSNSHSSQEDPWHGVPAWIRDDRPAIHEPGIIGRHINDFRRSWFDDDCVPLSRHFLLFIAI